MGIRTRVHRALARLVGRGGAAVYEGPYDSWEDALAVCDGYDAPEILEATRLAVTRHLRGEGYFERDSVLVETPDYSYFFLASVLRFLAQHKGTSQVVDFGGALGSGFYQCCSFLGERPNCVWHVVEQDAHVRCGKTEFENDHLKFYSSIEACLASIDRQPALLILSGVLHFLPTPYATLSTLVSHRFPAILIDRTPLSESPTETIYAYRVPPEIYAASYPFWLLSRKRLLDALLPGYELNAQYQGRDPLRTDRGRFDRWGFLLNRRAVGEPDCGAAWGGENREVE